MERLKKAFVNNIWIVLLDIIAVNASYYLALLIRFYVNSTFRPTVSYLLTDLYHFAPWYTVAAIIIFFIFRLYDGMWQYAGINDMNRIILANITTTVVQVGGTLIFIRRMPITYYVIGGILQFLFVAVIRFSYRFLTIERTKMDNRSAEPVLVVASGDIGHTLIKQLENGRSYRPVGVIDDSLAGKMMDGVQGYPISDIEKVIEKQDVKAIVIGEARPELKEKLKTIGVQKNVEVRDNSNYFSYVGESDANVSIPSTVSKDPNKRSIPFSPPDISEAEISEVCDALRSGWITTGPRTKHLERRLAAYIRTGRVDVDTESEPERWSNRVVCLNSATSAEELNLRLLGVGPGDEVICPAYTYTASASAAIHCGATVKFVDIQKDGDPVTHMPEMDYKKLEAAITEHTKAIIVVDLGGIVADYDRVFGIVEKKRGLFKAMDNHSNPLADLSSRIQAGMGRIAIVADDAHSLGACRTTMWSGKGNGEKQRRYAGAIADFTSFSFHAVKNFTTAEGGASTWCMPGSVYETGVTDAEIYRFYQLLSLHGQNKDALAKTKVGAWEYDIIGPWYKCNMTDIMAAIGLRQLDRYPSLLSRREEIMKKYDTVCDELGISHLFHHIHNGAIEMDSSNHLYLIRIPGIDVEKRNYIIEKMAELGIATNVHYKPMPMMTAYKESSGGIEKYLGSYSYYENLITLPLHTMLSDNDVEYVCECLRMVMK